MAIVPISADSEGCKANGSSYAVCVCVFSSVLSCLCLCLTLNLPREFLWVELARTHKHTQTLACICVYIITCLCAAENQDAIPLNTVRKGMPTIINMYIHTHINNAGMFAYVTVIWASPSDNIMRSYLLVMPQLFVFLLRIHFCLADCNINNKYMYMCKHIHTFMQMFCLFIVFNRVVSSHTSHSRLVSCPRNKNNKKLSYCKQLYVFVCVCLLVCASVPRQT